MTTAAHLWAIGYNEMGRADQVRELIIGLSNTQSLVLLDTAVAVRYPDGSVTLDGEPFVVATNSTGHTLASLLAALALAPPPLTGGAVDALLRSTHTANSAAIGLDEEFVSEVEAQMNPGASALFVLDREGDMDAFLQAIRGIGGTVLKTTVDLKRAKLIQATLAAKAVDDAEYGLKSGQLREGKREVPQ